jgi:hypothetical protein
MVLERRALSLDWLWWLPLGVPAIRPQWLATVPSSAPSDWLKFASDPLWSAVPDWQVTIPSAIHLQPS